MNDVTLSIIIVNWNGRRWLGRCLESLAAQSTRDFEVIMVDNDSSDDSVRFVSEHHDWVKIVRLPSNVGFAAGNNKGIESARGRLVMLLNNDTWFGPDLVASMIAEFDEIKPDVLTPRMAGYEGGEPSNFITTIDPLGFPTFIPVNPHDQRDSFYLSGSCIMFSRRLYDSTGGLDNNFFMYFEETDWFWRMRLMGVGDFRVSKFAVIHHAVAGSTGSGLRYKIFRWRNQNNLQMLLKNYSVMSLAAVLPVHFVSNVLEMLACLVILRFDLAWTYLEGWWFNLRHLNRTLASRRIVQSSRKVSDKMVSLHFYRGSAKLRAALGKARHRLKAWQRHRKMSKKSLV